MVDLHNLDLARIRDWDRGYIPGGRAIRPRGDPISLRAQHAEVFRQVVKHHVNEIDPNNLPRVVDLEQMRFDMSTDLACAFIWNPHGEWTGLVKVPLLFEEFERRLRHWVKREISPYGGDTRVFEATLDIRFPNEVAFRCKAWTASRGYRPVDELPDIRYALLFADFEQQARYASYVEETP